MKNRVKALKTAVILAAVTLTTGIPLSAQRGVWESAPITVYAADNESYTEGKSGLLTYRKYSDHVEISHCELSATSVEIPESIEGLPVTVIGIYAFQISKIQSVTIPNSVKEIGHYAFNSCSNLTSITIPDSVEKVGIRAFENCSSLEKIEFPDHIIEWNTKVFEGTPWISSQREKSPLVIVNGALLDGDKCKGEVKLTSDIKYIASGAFQRNMDITSVVVPSSVTKLCDNVFFYCTNLTSVELNGATLIGSMAFCGCEKLTDLKLSGKLTDIDERAFSDIKSNATITFYGSKETWEKINKPNDDPFLKNAKMIFDENHSDPNEEIAGDLNMDGEFNVADFLLLQKWLLGDKNAELKNWKAADYTKDEVLDVFDLVLMRKAIIKK
ncbi:MAG: leucine-rich repeat protein [Ruminococcus sp.]|uniref:leucine-rich repeat protein n=1 Tax=Ruminococcus sp. TaxID=41978 RepID=UPI0025F18309|nr:leucine-rich repeat protein [Ruminococcus sp.]MCR5599640.1 leucine-rich repeat protein [Ruminococcus sp.]